MEIIFISNPILYCIVVNSQLIMVLLYRHHILITSINIMKEAIYYDLYLQNNVILRMKLFCR